MGATTLTRPVPVEQARSPRLIAVMPAYNEEATIIGVLDALEGRVDKIVVVDDGSTDGTALELFNWASSRPHVQAIFLGRNRGMSYAYCAAFHEIGQRVARGDLNADDVILTIDADGQHAPEDIQALIARLCDGGYDAVIARRDLSGYPKYKRIGNWIMSTWATIWAGTRLFDVESGFRVFRADALLAALRFYTGYRYSETVEVAVILPRLGYRVDNDLLLPVPVFRSRTRLKDAIIDLAAMPAAWWRVFAGREAPGTMPRWPRYVLPALGPLLLAFMAVDLLIRPVFLGDDSIQNYAHVWFLSQQIFHHGRIPLRIAQLDDGRAATFPYGFAPYLAGAVLFRAFDSWSVSLLMTVAVIGTVWAAGLVRPVVRNPWFLLLFVLNPFFIDAVYAFQFPTLWCTLFFFLFVYAFERQRYVLAGALLWFSVSTHPLIGGAAGLSYAGALFLFDRAKLAPFVRIGALLAIALAPFYWMMLLTPAVHENSLHVIVASVADALPRRGSIFVMPFVLTLAAPYVRARYTLTLAAFGTAAAIGLLFSTGPLVHHGSYYGALYGSSDIYGSYFASPAFERGATYRVLEPNEREDGMYYFIQHGAVLSSEFFSESVFRRSWRAQQYRCYAAAKGIDYVVIERAYERDYSTNEPALLDSMVRTGSARLAYQDPVRRFQVYDIRPFVQAQSAQPIGACGLS